MGPMGQGPLTGRGSGWCGGAADAVGESPSWAGFGPGRSGGRGGGWRHRHGYRATGLPGWQRGWMGGRGRGAAFPSALAPEQELAALQQQATDLEHALGELKTRIAELAKPAADATSAPGRERP
jgi:hypothetical protein